MIPSTGSTEDWIRASSVQPAGLGTSYRIVSRPCTFMIQVSISLFVEFFCILMKEWLATSACSRAIASTESEGFVRSAAPLRGRRFFLQLPHRKMKNGSERGSVRRTDPFTANTNWLREEGKFGSGHSTGRVSLLHAPIYHNRLLGRLKRKVGFSARRELQFFGWY